MPFWYSNKPDSFLTGTMWRKRTRNQIGFLKTCILHHIANVFTYSWRETYQPASCPSASTSAMSPDSHHQHRHPCWMPPVAEQLCAPRLPCRSWACSDLSDALTTVVYPNAKYLNVPSIRAGKLMGFFPYWLFKSRHCLRLPFVMRSNTSSLSEEYHSGGTMWQWFSHDRNSITSFVCLSLLEAKDAN